MLNSISSIGFLRLFNTERREEKEQYLAFCSTMGVVEDYTLMVLCELASKYWHDAKQYIAELDLRHNRKKMYNDINKAMTSLMIDLKMTDISYTQKLSGAFKSYVKDFIADGYSFSVLWQRRMGQEARIPLQQLYYAYRNALLAQDCKYIDTFTPLLVMRELLAEARDVQRYTYDAMKKQAFNYGVKVQRKDNPSIDTAFYQVSKLIDLYCKEIRRQDADNIQNASTVLQKKIIPIDMPEVLVSESMQFVRQYADYVVANMLLEVRANKFMKEETIIELSKWFTGGEICFMLKELCKMRIGLGEDDAVELATMVGRAKNTPVLNKLKELIINKD